MYLITPVSRQVWDEETCEDPEPGCVCRECIVHVASFENFTGDTEPSPSIGYVIPEPPWDFVTFPGQLNLPFVTSAIATWTVPFQYLPDQVTEYEVSVELWGDWNDSTTLNAGGVFIEGPGWRASSTVVNGTLRTFVTFQLGGQDFFTGEITDIPESVWDSLPPLVIKLRLFHSCAGGTNVMAFLSSMIQGFKAPIDITPSNPESASVFMGIEAPQDDPGIETPPSNACCPEGGAPLAWSQHQVFNYGLDEDPPNNGGVFTISGTFTWDGASAWLGEHCTTVQCPGGGPASGECHDSQIYCDGAGRWWFDTVPSGGFPQEMFPDPSACDMTAKLRLPTTIADCFVNSQEEDFEFFGDSDADILDPRRYDNLRMKACGGIPVGECDGSGEGDPQIPPFGPYACQAGLWEDDLVPTFARVPFIGGLGPPAVSGQFTCDEACEAARGPFHVIQVQNPEQFCQNPHDLVIGDYRNSVPSDFRSDFHPSGQVWNNKLCDDYNAVWATCFWTAVTVWSNTAWNGKTHFPLVTEYTGVCREALDPICSGTFGNGPSVPPVLGAGVGPVTVEGVTMAVASLVLNVGGHTASYQSDPQPIPLPGNTTFTVNLIGAPDFCGGFPASLPLTFGGSPQVYPFPPCGDQM